MLYIRRLAAVLTLAVFAQSAGAQSVRLDAENLRVLAIQTLEGGDPASALDMADALLEANPADPAALVIRARALRDLGQNDAAIAAAVRAWDGATTPGIRFSAALVRAQALATDGQRLRAQWWLRRAAQIAPDARARALVERDFDYVRARTPLRLRFDVSLRPSSNLNNGSSQSTLTIPGLPFVFDIDGAGQALSGWQATMGFSGRYRLATTASAETDLTFALTQQSSLLSSEARAQAPLASNGDYDFAAIEAGLSRRWAATAATQLTANLTLGKNWYGGAALSQYTRLTFGSTTRISETLQLDLSVMGEDQNRADSASNDATILGANAAIRWQFASRDQMQIAVAFRDTRSDARAVDHHAASISATWAFAQPVLGTALSVSVDLKASDYARSAYAVDGRQDVQLGLSVDATLRNLDYLGFAPVLSVDVSETRSNINLYDKRDASVGLSITSTF